MYICVYNILWTFLGMVSWPDVWKNFNLFIKWPFLDKSLSWGKAIDPRDINLAQRVSIKKVTVIQNLEVCGLNPYLVAAILQHNSRLTLPSLLPPRPRTTYRSRFRETRSTTSVGCCSKRISFIENTSKAEKRPPNLARNDRLLIHVMYLVEIHTLGRIFIWTFSAFANKNI